MKILTAAQMQRIDRITTERYGVPSLTLMENAGRGVLEFLAQRFGPLHEQRIAILCGRGNNGGDGLVVARLLRGQGINPRVILLADPKKVKGDAAVNLERLTASGAPEAAEDSAAWQRVDGAASKARRAQRHFRARPDSGGFRGGNGRGRPGGAGRVTGGRGPCDRGDRRERLARRCVSWHGIHDRAASRNRFGRDLAPRARWRPAGQARGR